MKTEIKDQIEHLTEKAIKAWAKGKFTEWNEIRTQRDNLEKINYKLEQADSDRIDNELDESIAEQEIYA